VSEADFAREVGCPARRAAQLAIVRLHNEHYAICRLKEAINLEEKGGYIVKALALLYYGSVPSGLRANSPHAENGSRSYR